MIFIGTVTNLSVRIPLCVEVIINENHFLPYINIIF